MTSTEVVHRVLVGFQSLLREEVLRPNSNIYSLSGPLNPER